MFDTTTMSIVNGINPGFLDDALKVAVVRRSIARNCAQNIRGLVAASSIESICKTHVPLCQIV